MDQLMMGTTVENPQKMNARNYQTKQYSNGNRVMKIFN